jgi:hypothetical protein
VVIKSWQYCICRGRNATAKVTYVLVSDPTNFKTYCHVVHHVRAANHRSAYIATGDPSLHPKEKYG